MGVLPHSTLPLFRYYVAGFSVCRRTTGRWNITTGGTPWTSRRPCSRCWRQARCPDSSPTRRWVILGTSKRRCWGVLLRHLEAVIVRSTLPQSFDEGPHKNEVRLVGVWNRLRRSPSAVATFLNIFKHYKRLNIFTFPEMTASTLNVICWAVNMAGWNEVAPNQNNKQCIDD